MKSLYCFISLVCLLYTSNAASIPKEFQSDSGGSIEISDNKGAISAYVLDNIRVLSTSKMTCKIERYDFESGISAKTVKPSNPSKITVKKFYCYFPAKDTEKVSNEKRRVNSYMYFGILLNDNAWVKGFLTFHTEQYLTSSKKWVTYETYYGGRYFAGRGALVGNGMLGEDGD